MFWGISQLDTPWKVFQRLIVWELNFEFLVHILRALCVNCNLHACIFTFRGIQSRGVLWSSQAHYSLAWEQTPDGMRRSEWAFLPRHVALANLSICGFVRGLILVTALKGPVGTPDCRPRAGSHWIPLIRPWCLLLSRWFCVWKLSAVLVCPWVSAAASQGPKLALRHLAFGLPFALQPHACGSDLRSGLGADGKVQGVGASSFLLPAVSVILRRALVGSFKSTSAVS